MMLARLTLARYAIIEPARPTGECKLPHLNRLQKRERRTHRSSPVAPSEQPVSVRFSEDYLSQIPPLPELPAGCNPQFVFVPGEADYFTNHGVWDIIQANIPFKGKGLAIALHYSIIDLAALQGGDDVAMADHDLLRQHSGLNRKQQLITLAKLVEIGLLLVEADGDWLRLILPDLPLT